MKKILSLFLTVSIFMQLCALCAVTAYADTSVYCDITATAGNADSNVTVSASAVRVTASYDSNKIYTAKDVTFTGISSLTSGILLDHWEDSYGNNISQDSVYKQAIAKSVDYKAYYSPYTPQTKSMLETSDYDYSTSYKLTASTPVKVSEGGAVEVSATVAVPRKYDVVEAGAIFYEGIYKEGFNIFSDNITKVPVTQITKVTDKGLFYTKTTGKYSASYTPTQQYGVLSRAYCIYTDSSSRLHIGYSEPQYTRPDTDFYNNVKKYDVVFNWEMLATFTQAGTNTVHTEEFHKKPIRDVATSNPDMITVTPQMYRMNLWPTEIEGEGFAEKEKYLQEHPEYEIDYYLMSSKPSIGKTWYDQARDYIYIQGKDPTTEVLEAVNEENIDCFINYRMNDHHNTQTERENPDDDRTGYPTHSAFWLENEDEYGVGMSSYRVLNYMEPHIRDHYFSIIEELATKYVDYIDGIELDFDRYFTYFSYEEASQGREILNGFVARIREMLNRVGVQNGKYLQLSVRVPGQTAKGDHFGIDPITWDSRGYVDIIALSNHYFNTLDLDIEAYTENKNNSPRAHAAINGEIEYNTYQTGKSVTTVKPDGTTAVSSTTERRYLTKEGYYATATNFLNRGADGVHLFNVLYSGKKEELYPELAVLNDREQLAKAEKCYVMERGGRSGKYDGVGSLNKYVGFQRVNSTKTYNIYMPDDMTNYTKALIRLEYTSNKVDANGNRLMPDISVQWTSDSASGVELARVNTGNTELFDALAENGAYPTLNQVMFFEIPMEYMESSNGKYAFRISFNDDSANGDGTTVTTYVESCEIALYNVSAIDSNLMADFNPGFAGGKSLLTQTDTSATVAAQKTDYSQDGDGYVLSASNRTSEIAGGKFEGVSFTPGTLYFVSAFAKLANEGEANAVINVESANGKLSGSETLISSDEWTRVLLYYDITAENGANFESDVYVSTPGSYADILLDNFELLTVEPYKPVDGNIFADYNTSFEDGTLNKWTVYQANAQLCQADPLPYTGKWCGYSYNRDSVANTTANGFQTTYVNMKPDTYYYVSAYGRIESNATATGEIVMQFRLQSGKTTVSNKGGSVIKTHKPTLTNTEWKRMASIYKTTSAEEIEASYPGYSIKAKVYPGMAAAHNVYLDDLAAVPICINDGYKTVTPQEECAKIELTVPVEFAVTKDTLSTNVGVITDISRRGTVCMVTIDGLKTATDGELKLKASDVIAGSPDIVMNFKVRDTNNIGFLSPGFENGNNCMSVADEGASISVVQTADSHDGDGYVLSVSNRNSEIAGGKFEQVQFIPQKLYVVSAFAKLANSGSANAKINVEKGTEVVESDSFAISADKWTRVFFYYDLTGTDEEQSPANIYLSTPGSKADVLLDNYQVFEVLPYTPVDGNIYGEKNTSFETGTTSSWVVNKAKAYTVQADPFPRSGKWCGYSYERNSSTSYANGFQTSYVNVVPDTYYYVSGWARTDTDVQTQGKSVMQFQLKKGSTTKSSTGGSAIKEEGATLDNTKWSRMHALYKSMSQEDINAKYPGYTIQAKIYPNVDSAYNVYADDFAAVPICINSDSKMVTLTNSTAVVKMTVPVEFEVDTTTLSSSAGEIDQIERNGATCIVTISELAEGMDVSLTLKTSDVIADAPAVVMSFKTNGYGITAKKSDDGKTINCVFTNNTASSVTVRYYVVAYNGENISDISMLDAVTVSSYGKDESITVPVNSEADRVELLAWGADNLVPYTIPLNLSDLQSIN